MLKLVVSKYIMCIESMFLMGVIKCQQLEVSMTVDNDKKMLINITVIMRYINEYS